MIITWGKIIKNNKIISDKTVETIDLSSCVEELCNFFDIPKPIWMNKHHKEIALYLKTYFSSDSFVEKIDFDKFEIEIFEDEKPNLLKKR